jgi:type VI secretion system protein ImpM
MRCALFGKVPSKRDFVAPHASRSFLNLWEKWIQAGMSASRQSLGDGWQAVFLKAPIWRFWLGAELCGTTVTGAFMPSLDGVGRYFPLTAFACSDEGAAIPPPELNPQDEWFLAMEEFLLSTLDHDTTYEAISASLDALAPPCDQPLHGASDGMTRFPDGLVARHESNRPLGDLFAAMRVADSAKAYASMTYWWTIGGENYEPIAVMGRRMPDPFLFTEMLTGKFAFEFE